MLTTFGKKIRILRIQENETLYDMARKLGVTSSYLSAIEHGKRSIPPQWIDRIADLYCLTSTESQELERAAEESLLSLRINLTDIDKNKKRLAILFQQSLTDLDDDSIRYIESLLSHPKSNNKNVDDDKVCFSVSKS